jgi:hypothetical protein
VLLAVPHRHKISKYIRGILERHLDLSERIWYSPVTGLEWPRGFQEVRVPRLHDSGTGWWYGGQPYAPAAFTPKKCCWYSFLLEAESTADP